ncbi:MAG: TrkH family potassium uptake protein [Saprospiraceae bacterium]|nr:TrkH family potassium uptake protein [Saprospiraceae bacterium]
MKLNLQPISNVLGVLIIILGISMFVAAGITFYYEDKDFWDLVSAAGITVFFGVLMWWYKFNTSAIVNKKEGYLIVALGWVFMGLFGALPYFMTGVTTNFTDAVFESVSGLTTTGATVFSDIESLSHGILFWRSMTQWIGGMGIIVLTIALFPLLGIAGIELFVAEAPGPTTDKLHPRIKETAKRLWFIYFGLTMVLFVLLYFQGLTVFDAINHAFTTMATGGFSTKNASIAFYTSPLIQYTIVLFMFLAGCNYAVIYHSLKGNFNKVWSNDEFRYYTLLIIGLALILGLLININIGGDYEKNFRDGLFQLVSIITTTGFVTADYTKWSQGLTMFFFILLFVGACAGSTSGGIKIIRHIVFVKNTFLEFRRILHPRALIRVKINQQVVAPRILTHILVFLLVYLIIFIVGSLIVTSLGMDFISSISAVATCLGNVGPGLGSVGPVNNFSEVPMFAKQVLVMLMLLGRLELFTILILFSRSFWRTN